MNSEIKKVLNQIEKNGFEAYVVGGFVRDFLLGRKTNDVDICTNALPKEIQSIFGTSKEMGVYGSYNLKTSHFNYDITTYRKERDYIDRKPSTVEYSSNLIEDLPRRDFTMNAICMNENGEIIDYLNGVDDVKNKLVRIIGDPFKRIGEDPLRILRAIRFSCTLHFKIEHSLWNAIKEKKHLVLELSNERIKRELNAIFLSPNFQKGLDLLEELDLLNLLDLQVSNMCYVNDVCGMWAQVKSRREYPFLKVEKKQISNIQKVLNEEKITSYTLYQYGLYPVLVAAKIKNIPESLIYDMYKNMPIHELKDLHISFDKLLKILKKDAKEVKEIQEVLIKRILDGKLENKEEAIFNALRGKL